MTPSSRPAQRAIRWGALIALALPWGARANDGVDRYQQQGYPALLYHLDGRDLDGRATPPLAGYRLLDEDKPGGADGSPAYRWAARHAIALVRVAAYDATRTFGAAPFPMAIFDLAAENADTPVDFGAAGGPRGRHPGGSHDGGINLDLGYYLQSTKGRLLDPDLSACSDHYEAVEGGAPRDVFECRGPPDRLAVAQQTYFFVRLFQIDQVLFQERLLEEIGIDSQIRSVVMEQALTWAKQRKYGVSGDLLARMDQVFVSDRYEGWARYHHHHCHVRLQSQNTYGPLRGAFEKLVAMDRERLVSLGKGAIRLEASLMSSHLERAIEVRLLPDDAQGVSGARYRLDGGAWVAPPASEGGRHGWRHVFELPSGPRAVAGEARIEAEVKRGERSQTLSARIALPVADPRLRIAADPARFEGWARRQGEAWRAGVRVPVHVWPLVTGVSYLLYKGDAGTPRRIEGRREAAWETELGPLEGIVLVEARIELSGRLPIPIPVWTAKGRQ